MSPICAHPPHILNTRIFRAIAGGRIARTERLELVLKMEKIPIEIRKRYICVKIQRRNEIHAGKFILSNLNYFMVEFFDDIISNRETCGSIVAAKPDQVVTALL